MQLRDYQKRIAQECCDLLFKYHVAYLSMEVRTGKTITALEGARLFGAARVCFITKKKAISSIEADFDTLSPGYTITVTNYEQAHNLSSEYDIFILDEAHCLGQFPVPAMRTIELRDLCEDKPIIFLSGTPTPESYSQIYHQFFVSSFSPFSNKNFYAWANAGFVTKRTKYIYNRQLNDYSGANKDKIDEACKHLFISYSQEDAGFKQSVDEEILTVPMDAGTYLLAEKIIKKRVHIGANGEEVIADTEVKLMQKLHQIFSGTVKTEQGVGIAFDKSKVAFIKQKFAGQKIAVFYNFVAEYDLLCSVFDDLTSDPEQFNSRGDLVFCSQIKSGREGINLSMADAIVMLNIDFSSVSYQQAKARMQAKDRVKPCKLYWIFSESGFEKDIYDRVIDKQDYTLSYFKKKTLPSLNK